MLTYNSHMYNSLRDLEMKTCINVVLLIYLKTLKHITYASTTEMENIGKSHLND